MEYKKQKATSSRINSYDNTLVGSGRAVKAFDECDFPPKVGDIRGKSGKKMSILLESKIADKEAEKFVKKVGLKGNLY